MAVTLASNTYRREQSRLVLVVGDDVVAPLVLSLTLGVISRGLVRSEDSLSNSHVDGCLSEQVSSQA
jgi:hypothetical protein